MRRALPLIILFLTQCVFPAPAFGQQIQIRAGFAVERVCTPKSQGSWVAMCFDDRGRIYASAEGTPGLFRVTPPPLESKEECKVELVSDKWGHCQGMSFINGSLYVVQHGSFPQKETLPSTILRLKDTDGDDKLDSAETLFTFPALTDGRKPWWEHHVHGIVPGPDGKSLYVVGGDRDDLPCEKGRTQRHWNRDSWDFKSIPKPYAGGYVLKTDLDGKNPEWLCMGLRNCYDIAFNRHGDLFTCDSDLEFDVGMPNYRPTAIRQILSGTDSGWAGRGPEMRWSWLKYGKVIVGRFVETVGDTHVVATNPANQLADHVRINKKDVESIMPSRVSAMPADQLNTLTQDDVFDLLAYMLGR